MAARGNRNDTFLNSRDSKGDENDDYTEITEDDDYTEIDDDSLPTEIDDNSQHSWINKVSDGKRYTKWPPNSAKGTKKKKRETGIVCAGICYLEKGVVIVVTKQGHLFVFSAKGVLLSRFDFGYSFEDVAAVSDCRVAASGEYFIKFFKLDGNDITEDEENEVNYSYAGQPSTHGISSDQNIILVSCNVQMVETNIEPFLRIFNLKGHAIKDISLQGTDEPMRVDFCQKHKLIYLMDYRNKALVCISYDGKEIWRAFLSSPPTDIKLLPGYMLAVVTENSNEISFIDDKTGECHDKSTELMSAEPSGFLVDSDRKGELFLCRVDHKSLMDITVIPIEKQHNSETVMKKLMSKFGHRK